MSLEEETDPKVDNRYKVITLPDGSTVKRIEYIQELYRNGVSRSEITKKLSDLAGEKIPYQIVFAATKNLTNSTSVEDSSDDQQEIKRGVVL